MREEGHFLFCGHIFFIFCLSIVEQTCVCVSLAGGWGDGGSKPPGWIAGAVTDSEEHGC